MPYLYETYELQLLGSFLHSGAQAANVVWKPTSAVGDSELDSNEVAEVVYLEIVPPVTGAGVAEPLEKIALVLDNKSYEEYINIIGTDTFLFCPPKTNLKNGVLLAFGTPMVYAVKGQPLFDGTCPKFTKSVKIETTAGAAGITEDYLIRIWGYRYPTQELPRLIGSVGGRLEIHDDRTDRTLIVDKPSIVASFDTWTQLPGGIDQSMPKINTLIRYARNAVATVANTPYRFRYEGNFVGSRVEDLYFPFDIETKAFLIKGFGVNAPANLAETFFIIDGKDRPKKRYPTTQFNNMLHFGRAYPLYPADFPQYFTIPKLDRPYLVWQDKGDICIQDDGNVIAIDQITVALNGLLIEM